MKIYTKTGDEGSTSLWSGKRVPKNHSRLKAYGTVDELNSVIALVLSECPENYHKKKDLQNIQRLLFLIGSYLSCDKEELAKSLPSWNEKWVEHLEQSMDEMDASLQELKNFILPGGSKLASFCHLARCVCRRAEREVADCPEEILFRKESSIYLNRLSDYFFVLARKSNQDLGIEDQIWQVKDLSKG